MLDSLEKRLFPDSKEMIAISSLLKKGRSGQEIDSIYFVRKVQPNFDTIFIWLKNIAYTEDVGLLDKLIDLYSRQQLYFKKEWEAVHRQNIYACDEVNEQFWILESFEEAIHSLKFTALNLSPEGKYLYLKDYLKFKYDYYRVKGAWFEALNGWRIYSPYYMMLRKKKWVAPPLSKFLFIEPYIDEVEKFIIEDYLNSYEVESGDCVEPIPCYMFESLCSVISFSRNVKYNEEIVRVILLQKEINDSQFYGCLVNLIRNPIYYKEIEKTLIRESGSRVEYIRLNAFRGMIYFHRKDIVKLYRKLIKRDKVNELEKEEIIRHLSILDKQNAASKKIKRMGSRLLKRIEK